MAATSSILIAAATLLLSAAPVLRAQALRVQPTPFSVWLDLRASAPSSKSGFPIWMESLQRTFTPEADGALAKTVFRLRLRRIVTGEIQLRLFFTDTLGNAPVVSGWSETGKKLYESQPLGSGLELPTSETVIIPVSGLDYVEVSVPGDGANLSSVFVATLKKYEGRKALDFEKEPAIDDPFSNLPPAAPGSDDSYLYGRVKATIEAGAIKLSPKGPRQTLLEFDLESAPLVAVISFEILNADPFNPPEITLNKRALGRASIRLPDLADPGYQGSVRALEPDMRFRYAGWMQCQQLVPGSLLLSGANKLTVTLGKESPPIAIRAVEIELKTNWKHLNYELIP